MENYSAIKNNEIKLFAATQMNLEMIKLSKVRKRRQVPCDLTCMWI